MCERVLDRDEYGGNIVSHTHPLQHHKTPQSQPISTLSNDCLRDRTTPYPLPHLYVRLYIVNNNLYIMKGDVG